ncbi:MAG: hypothetical protein GEU74_05395 [Nitriliruptorales bacterium]|nr:hypothetical protein [Nitriliruptorales bacterium]
MNDDFRQRVFLPVIMPVGAVIGFFGFAFMLSRILLAVEEMASTTIALGLAAYILAIAAIVSAKPRITSRALFVGVTLGIVAIVAAGTIAASIGMRELHAEDGGEAAASSGDQSSAPAPTEAADAAAPDSDQLEFTAIDISFDSAPETASAGRKQVTLVNDGQAQHNVTFPELDDAPVVEADPGETGTGQIDLDPGTYKFICSVPGHEGTMNGELTVE